MKELLLHSFDPRRCREELEEFEDLLSSGNPLKERASILPFFKKRKNVSSLISCYNPYIKQTDRMAHEFPIEGDFKTDLIIGDSKRGEFLLVEFEDASSTSIFRRIGKKATPEWSSRYEHAVSQMIDWMWKLEDMRSTANFSHVFGGRNAHFLPLIVIGRGDRMGEREGGRLAWRTEKLIVDSRHLLCVTYDRLLEDLNGWLTEYYRA